ncbi:glycoside hydrolase family 19 protein [Brevundimonas sp. SGAir0440]|uniref:glycoside hydrolase family 19 protein n=1 Tax=Brevundimonas sp. SGAir0440 TaxID=2579977 RepID=UPI0010CD53AC|nr:glycoside hydrolase family 19 protein [Brevundimonas sp. SGAir0440]QCQ97771.1 glycoside hydrolase family 19 protein [Brevundimonas sp. SGAir0440]
MSLIPADRFRTFAPKATAGTREALEAAAAANGFSGLVLAHWLGQTFVESAGFTTREENLNYSVDGLLKMFGRHRISEADARKFGRAPGRPAHQNAIANIIYGGEWGRKNLGNTEPGDGWRFRGGGEKQITGRANYREAWHEHDPDTLRTDPVASARAAANFFVKHGCIAPALRDDVKGVTLKVNGGTNGLDARIAATTAAKKVVGL